MVDEIKKNTKLKGFVIVIFAVVAILLLFSGLYTVFQLNKVKTAEPPAPLPEIDIYKILPVNCDDCFNIEVAEKFVKDSGKAKVLSSKALKSSEDDAKEFIKKYNLSRLPAMVITGEASRLTIEPFVQRGDALVFDQTPPPYFDVASAKVKGKVSVTIVSDKSCEKCTDMQKIAGQLKQAGVAATTKLVDSSSKDGKDLIQKYKIKKLPVMLLSKDALEYQIISGVWDNVGTKESDGTLVLRQVSPPYEDVDSGKIKGLVSLTFVTDKSCAKCYNVSLHKALLQSNFGMAFADENYVDVSSRDGAKLLAKYKISAVPTAIISPEAKEYPNFKQAWKNVGETAGDGSFVFKKLELLQGMTYKDLKNKTTVTVPGNPQPRTN